MVFLSPPPCSCSNIPIAAVQNLLQAIAVHCDILAKQKVHAGSWSQGQGVRQAWKNQQMLRGERWEREREKENQ